ncbi:MAG: GPH family glycoside/pentoside/hexuronide:cation symporter [Litorivivens sp.]|jgi:GPH family glycoside/pentoside/hexuronide:cation symporter
MNLTTKLGYGVGQAADGIKTSAFTTFMFFYYNQVLGLSGSLAGAAALLALLVDAVTDPMVGQYSDRFRSRWGRRHPFMIAGSIPFCFAMVALFSPPAGLSEMQLFGWMLGGAILVRLMLTLFFVPHLSLGAEMVRDYHERTKLVGYRVFFSYAGIVATSVLGFAVFFPATEQYPNGMLDPNSYTGFGVFTGVTATCAMLIAIFTTWKLIPGLAAPDENQNGRNAMLAFVTVFLTLKQHAFRVLFSVSLAFMVLSGVTQTLIIYVASYIFEFKPEHMALLAASVLVGIFLAPWLAQGISRRFDKKMALAICVTMGSTVAALPFILYFLDLFQPLSIVQRLTMVFVGNGISQGFMIAYVIVIDSMLSDTVDEHELNTGRREEGLFFAARSLATKASFGLGSFLAGVALDIIQFPQGANPDNVPQAAIDKLALLSGPISIVLFVATILISSRYPLNALRHRQILKEIEAKKVGSAKELRQ